jgi:hypothetical protein
LFSYTGIETGHTIASASGNLIVMPNNGWGGHVGIGTTNPAYPLQVNTGATQELYLTTNGHIHRVRFRNNPVYNPAKRDLRRGRYHRKRRQRKNNLRDRRSFIHDQRNKVLNLRHQHGRGKRRSNGQSNISL